MKKLLLAFLAAALFVAPAFAEDDDFVIVKVDGNLFIQGGAIGYKSNIAYDRGNDALYAVSVNLSKEFSNGGKVVLNIKGGNGGATLYGFNDATHDTDSSFARVTEFSYQQPIVDGWANVKFGRIGTIGGENNVAGSADTQFIHPLFAGEVTKIGPSNYSEGDAYGVQVTVSPAPFLDVTYEYAASGDADQMQLDANGWNGIQLTFKFSETGNYRILYWTSSEYRNYYDEKGFDYSADKSGGPSGFAISIDQEVVTNVSLFARYGQALDKNYLMTVDGFDDNIAYSFGAQLNGGIWSRDNDVLGIAAGQRLAPSYGDQSTTTSISSELYYKISINDFIAISPSVQYTKWFNSFIDSNVSYAVRTHISF